LGPQRRVGERPAPACPGAAYGRRGQLHLPDVRDPVRGRVHPAAGRPGRRRRHREEGLTMLLNEFLFLAAFLFCVGVYGALARKNAVLVLMSIELILNAVNINLVAFAAYGHLIAGQVFALFVVAIAAAEVGVGLAIVLLIYRNRHSVDLTSVNSMKG